jgi:hypothetical protein
MFLAFSHAPEHRLTPYQNRYWALATLLWVSQNCYCNFHIVLNQIRFNVCAHELTEVNDSVCAALSSRYS